MFRQTTRLLGVLLIAVLVAGSSFAAPMEPEPRLDFSSWMDDFLESIIDLFGISDNEAEREDPGVGAQPQFKTHSTEVPDYGPGTEPVGLPEIGPGGEPVGLPDFGPGTEPVG